MAQQTLTKRMNGLTARAEIALKSKDWATVHAIQAEIRAIADELDAADEAKAKAEAEG